MNPVNSFESGEKTDNLFCEIVLIEFRMVDTRYEFHVRCQIMYYQIKISHVQY